MSSSKTNEMPAPVLWQPLSFLSANCMERFALLILNQDLLVKKDIMVHLWNRAKLRVTVDGGTDKWLQWVQDSGACGIINLGLPDLVTGDFDSIRPETLISLREKGVPTYNTPDQDKHDFCKAVEKTLELYTPDLIVVVSEVSGRLDQILAQLNTLHLHKTCIVLLSSTSATWLLGPGSHVIDVTDVKSNPILSHDRWIGLLPVGAPATVTTSGLKYNVENFEMKFGGLVGSSNTYSSDPIIKITTDQPLIYSMGLTIGNKDNKS